jgi:hypothetical protein
LGDRGAAAIAAATSGKLPRRPVKISALSRVSLTASANLTTNEGDVLLSNADGMVLLQPGGAYQLTIGLWKTAGAGADISIGETSRFEIEWRGDSALKWQDDPYELGAADFAEGSCMLDFSVEVPSGLATSDGEIRLRYNDGSIWQSRALLRVGIRGDHYNPPAHFADDLKVDLPPKPDASLAFVHVSAVEDELSLKCFHALAGPLSTTMPQPKMSLADVADEEPSIKVNEVVLEYSRKSVPKLLAWLDDVLKKSQDDVAIVIVEHADTRVPWEMLVLEAGDVPLGARAMVTRWTSVQRYKDSVRLAIENEETPAGQVLNFVDTANLAHTRPEHAELLECAGVASDSVTGLLKSLRKLPPDVALVFLACHGVFARDEHHRTELKDLANPSGYISTLKLEGLTLPSTPPALIVNACHSARLTRTHHGISGLPEFFLSSFARSFLGTIGAVDDAVAAAVGAGLLKAARGPDGVRIPEFLLQLRKKAAADFKKDAIKARAFVSHFMYVFYGSPRERIRLKSKAKAGDG